MVNIRDSDVVQTEKMCMKAVKADGLALQYVRYQTDTICLCAVKECGYALHYAMNQTGEICMEAVKQNSYALHYARNQTEELCLCAVKQNGCALRYVRNQTEELCLCAVKQNGCAIRYVRNQTDDICLCAVKQNEFALQYVHNQTEDICLKALASVLYVNFHIIYNVIKYPSPQLVTQLLKLYPSHNTTIITKYVTTIMKNYKTGSDAICTTLIRHATDLLYRPNNVNALVGQMKWFTTTSNAKIIFLKS